MTFEGIITAIRFRNEENGYSVATLYSEEDGEIVIVGSTPFLKEHDQVRIEGELVYHPTYGEQIAFQQLEVVLPTTEIGIMNYLSSGLIPFIGTKTAKKIVDRFGTDTLEILQDQPERLLEIPGIGNHRLEAIKEAFQEQAELRSTMLYLQKYGIGVAVGLRLFRKYGAGTVEILSENPYRLSDEVDGIGFKKADEIAVKMGYALDSRIRIQAGLTYALMTAASDGNTYLPLTVLIRSGATLLSLPEEILEDGVRMLGMRDEIYIMNGGDDHYVYYKPYHLAENYVADKLCDLSCLKGEDTDFSELIELAERHLGIRFAEKQKEAITTTMLNGVSVITGGPGTGKTTVINGIIRLCEDLDMELVLAAPTGRAAKRMTETTGMEAKTVHRLLEYTFGEEEGGFQRNEENPVEADVVLIDEASMLDIILAKALLKAVAHGTRLVLVGDVDQLPSVRAGNVLSDIIASGIVPVVRLDEIFRQAGESMIVVNAHRINHGENPILNEKDKDFYFIQRESQKEILKTILDLLGGRLSDYYGVDSLRDIQVLSPMKKGETGVYLMNRSIQETLNPPSEEKEERRNGDDVFRVGDKVMQIKNNYELKYKYLRDGVVCGEGEGLYNGDIGYITEIDEDSRTVSVLFDGEKLAEYEFGAMDDLVLAYATTVHKSQGSEFPVVVMPVTAGPPMLLNRNLLYTAITRAKRLVVLVGEEKCLQRMVSNTVIKKRYSALDKKMKDIMAWKG